MVRGLGAVSDTVILRTAVQQNVCQHHSKYQNRGRAPYEFYHCKPCYLQFMENPNTLLFTVHGEPQLTCAASIHKLSHRSRSESEIAAARTAESVCNQGTDVDKQLLE